jgi:hypothetical protein
MLQNVSDLVAGHLQAARNFLTRANYASTDMVEILQFIKFSILKIKHRYFLN